MRLQLRRLWEAASRILSLTMRIRAKRMIAFLKKNKFGRATFLPLTSMHGGGGVRTPEALKEPGVIGLANTLVHVEDRFTGLADQLLGRTIVVRTIDDGITIARKYRQSLRLVTL